LQLSQLQQHRLQPCSDLRNYLRTSVIHVGRQLVSHRLEAGDPVLANCVED
jgi:hypothetical protein